VIPAEEGSEEGDKTLLPGTSGAETVITKEPLV
jgi:hypothetical protein